MTPSDFELTFQPQFAKTDTTRFFDKCETATSRRAPRPSTGMTDTEGDGSDYPPEQSLLAEGSAQPDFLGAFRAKSARANQFPARYSAWKPADHTRDRNGDALSATENLHSAIMVKPSVRSFRNHAI